MNRNIGDLLMKEIMKYRSHPSIIAIKENCSSGLSFRFSQVNKATQNTYIPTILIKKNSYIVGDAICRNYNNCVSCSIFPTSLRNEIITPAVHKDERRIGINVRKVYERLMFKN